MTSDQPDRGGLLRPYAITGGRTKATRDDLEVEAQVLTTLLGEPTRHMPEHRSVVQLCRQPQSIAEISARLNPPLGVARVLVGDLADQQLVTVQRPSHTNHPDPALLERVLHGLRQI